MTELYISPSVRAYDKYCATAHKRSPDVEHVRTLHGLQGYHMSSVKIIRGSGFGGMDKEIRLLARDLEARVIGVGLHI